MTQVVNRDALQNILDEMMSRYTASVDYSKNQSPANFFKIGPIPLDTAPTVPYRIGGPFKGIAVLDASDTDATVKLFLHTDSDYARNNAIPLKKRDALSFDMAVATGYLTWDAQAGKTATLYLAVDGTFQFGISSVALAGGVAIQDGSAVTQVSVSMGDGVTTEIFPASTARKQGTFINNLGTDIIVGNASVNTSGPNLGIRIPPGASFTWKNTAALSGIQVSGGPKTLATLVES